MRSRIEMKYAVLTAGFLASLFALQQAQTFTPLDTTVNDLFGLMAGFGFMGLFVMAAIANASLLIHIPYTVPLLSLALSGASLSHMLLMGLASGLGAAFGEVVSYSITLKLVGGSPALQESALLQWVKRTVNAKPRMAPVIVFACAASPLPDDTLTLPLAMVGYGLKKMLLPLTTGKMVHNLVFAGTAYFFTSWSAEHVSPTVQVDLALGIVILFIMVTLYQVEKLRAMKGTLNPECAR